MSTLIRKLQNVSPPPWSFAQFMKIALYDEDVGYYTSNTIKLGKEGDFYTSNHVHPVFSHTFARCFLDLVEKEDLPLTICEFGAGDGSFANDTLTYLQENSSKNVTYLIVEASHFHRGILRKKLAPFRESVEIFGTMEEMRIDFPQFEGIIFTNEFLDALPVYVIEQASKSLLEVQVDIGEEGSFVEKLADCENEQILEWINRFGPILPEHYRTEICLEMRNWLEKLAEWLNRGVIFTVDYGYENSELLPPERREGSIRGYKNHQMISNPLKYPGQMDLTAHIQWDAFRQISKEDGLTEVIHDRQDKFLVKAGLFSFLTTSNDGTINPFSEEFKKNRAIQSFVHPGGISSAFQVNIQGKELKNQHSYVFFNEDPYKIK